MSCRDCNGLCRQGRDCPLDKPTDFRKMWSWILKTITKK